MRILEKNIINLYGQKGTQWLADLPKLTAQMEIDHGLSDLKPVKNLSYNYVLSGLQESQPIILKLSPDIGGLKREATALKAFVGFGVVKVLAESDGILLLERAVSGISLKSYFPEKDNNAIHIVSECLKRLHQAPIPHVHAFPHIKDWLIALDKHWEIPENYLQKAKQLRDDLLNTSSASVLLHGDLHHDNVLKNGDNWIVIDPKGVIGEPAYEVAAFIRNPMPELLAKDNAASIISYRITKFSEILELPERRIINWCFVQAVLAWAWALEDGHDDTYFKQLTQIFYRENYHA
jgi:streptomycin 6-kinase